MNKKRTTLFIFALVLMLIPSFAFARPIDVEIEDDHGNIVYRKENGNVVLNKMPRLDNTPYVSPGSKIEYTVRRCAGIALRPSAFFRNAELSMSL